MPNLTQRNTVIRVLYVVHNAHDQAQIGEALDNSPYLFDLHIASTLAEVTFHVLTHPYNLILVDYNLTGFDALDVLDQLTALNRDIPVVVLAGTAALETAAAAVQQGVADFVVKDGGQLVRLPYVIWAVLERHELEVDRREKERALRESEAKLRATFNQSLDIIIIIDVQDGTILNANRTVQRLLGYDPQMLIGQPYTSLFPQSTPAERATSSTSAGGGQLLAGVNTADSVFVSQPFLRADGSVVPMDLTANMLMWGNHKAILMTLRDASERIEAESNRLRAETLREKLHQEKELRMLRSRLVSMISHEFRTPLASMMLSVDLLEMKAEAAAGEAKWEAAKLHEIRQQIHRMTSLVDDILFVDKMESGLLPFNPVPTDIVAMVEGIVQDVQGGIGADHEISCAFSLPSIQVMVDHKLFAQLLNNLLSNAIKYSQMGTRISVSVGLTDDAFHLAVADEGIGIPDRDKPNLFDMFHRANNTGAVRGTGVGLAIVKQAVDLHGGRVSFESEVNVGTAFMVDIPLELPGHDDTAR